MGVRATAAKEAEEHEERTEVRQGAPYVIGII
jgi:hypothetical protein